MDEVGDAKAVLRIAELEQRGVIALAGPPGTDPDPQPAPPPGVSHDPAWDAFGGYWGHTIRGGAGREWTHGHRRAQAEGLAPKGSATPRGRRC